VRVVRVRRGIRRAAGARVTAVRPSRATEQLVMSRSEAHCEIGHVCGGAYLSGNRGTDWDLSHRCHPGAGGSRLDWMHAPSNLLASCRADHSFVHANGPWAVDRGLLIRRGTVRPLTTVVDCRHGRVLLDDAGTWAYAVTV
jgi:hypothetical protein